MTYHICIYSNVVLFITSKGARGTELPPPFLTFCSYIHFQYNFFIISSLFPYFNLSVSIFIQSYVKSNLHVSTLIIYIGSTHVKLFRKIGWVSIPPKSIKVLSQSFRFTRSKNFDQVFDRKL